MPDWRIKNKDDLVSRVNYICKKICEEAHAPKKKSEVPNKFSRSKHVNKLQNELVHTSAEIIQAAGRAKGLKLIGKNMQELPWKRPQRLMYAN